MSKQIPQPTHFSGITWCFSLTAPSIAPTGHFLAQAVHPLQFSSIISAFFNSTSLTIAFVGHLVAQIPQEIHLAGSILAKFPITVIASTGQFLAQIPQPIQATEQFFLATAPLSLEEQVTVTFLFCGNIAITFLGQAF